MEKAILKLTELYADQVKLADLRLHKWHTENNSCFQYRAESIDKGHKLAGMNELMKKRDERIKVLEGQLADYLNDPKVVTEEDGPLKEVIEKIEIKLREIQATAHEQAVEVIRLNDTIKTKDEEIRKREAMRHTRNSEVVSLNDEIDGLNALIGNKDLIMKDKCELVTKLVGELNKEKSTSEAKNKDIIKMNDRNLSLTDKIKTAIAMTDAVDPTNPPSFSFFRTEIIRILR